MRYLIAYDIIRLLKKKKSIETQKLIQLQRRIVIICNRIKKKYQTKIFRIVFLPYYNTLYGYPDIG